MFVFSTYVCVSSDCEVSSCHWYHLQLFRPQSFLLSHNQSTHPLCTLYAKTQNKTPSPLSSTDFPSISTPAARRLSPSKTWRHTIHNVLICFFYIVRYHIFKRKHSFYVQISGSGNKIFFICIFSCKLITDQMTAVIQIFSIDKIIFHSMPAGRLYRTNIPTLLRLSIRSCPTLATQTVHLPSGSNSPYVS